MSKREAQRANRGFQSQFWDGVEAEIEALDPVEFAEFVNADQLALEPRPGFEASLRTRLRQVVQRCYAH